MRTAHGGALQRLSLLQTSSISLVLAACAFLFGEARLEASQPWVCGSCFYVACTDPPSCENCGVYESWDSFYGDGYCIMCGEGRCIYRGSDGEPCAECDSRWMQECLVCGI